MDEILDINKIADEYANKFYNKDANPISHESLTQPFIDGFNKALEYSDEQTCGFAEWKDKLFTEFRKDCFDYYESTGSYVIKSNKILLEIYKQEINGK